MSKFFKALERAEQERAAGLAPPAGPPVPPAPEHRDEPVSSPAGPAAVGPVQETAQAKGRPEVAPRPPVEEPAVALDEHLVSFLRPTGHEAEQYRTLRHLLEQYRRTAGVSVIAVASPAVGDGKTVTAINLAGALAQGAEARVLLVDADLRRPGLASQLGLPDPYGPGLVDAVLDADLRLDDVVRRQPPFTLDVLSAGQPTRTPYEVFRSPRFGALLEEARGRYDYVLVDTPPFIPVPDCRVIEKLVDGVLLVVAAHRTPRKLVDETLALIDPSRLLALVFNSDDQPVPGYYYGGQPGGPAAGRRRPGLGWWPLRRNGGPLEPRPRRRSSRWH